MPRPVTGKELRDSFAADIESLTFGLIRVHDNALRLGPLELIRFGRPRITATSVQWPIEGGLLARSAGGHLRTELLYGRLVESLEGYKPMLPRPIYAADAGAGPPPADAPPPAAGARPPARARPAV